MIKVGYTFKLIIIIIALTMGIMSCDKKHEYPVVVRPYLSQYQVEIPLGQTVEIEVYDANVLNVEGTSRYVDISVDGSRILLYGKAIGSGEIVIRGDGTPLRCSYEVYGGIDDKEDSGNSDNNGDSGEILREVEDRTPRFTYDSQKFTFETPGNLFALSKDKRILLVTSLITGMEAKIISQLPLTEISLSSDISTDCDIQINGIEIGIKEVRLINITSDRIWIRAESTDHSILWFVMEI